MTRLSFGIIVLFVLVMPCSASDLREVLLPELVGRADVIVIGTVLKAGDPYSAKVTETLAGAPAAKVTFIVPRWQEYNLRAGETRIFFLLSRKGELLLLPPAAYEDPARAAETR